MDQDQTEQPIQNPFGADFGNEYLTEHYRNAIYGAYPDAQATASTDNEFVNLIRDFVIDKSLKAQFEYYLKYQPPTPKASHKLKIFLLFCINSQFVTSNIPTGKDLIEQRRLQARYKLIVAQLPLGLTRYDINDSFIHLTSLIDHLYQNQLLRARGGFTMKRVSTKTIEAGGFGQDHQGNEQEKSERSILQKMRIQG